MNKQEIQSALEKARKQLSVVKEPDEIEFANKKIAKLESELAEAEKAETEFQQKKEKSKLEPKKPKKKKAKKGKGVRALIPDKPIEPIDDNDPDCQELLKKHREAAKKRRLSAKKRANKPMDDQVIETVERATDSVETKVEKMEQEDESLDSDAVKKLETLSDNLAKNIVEAISSEKLRKQFIQNLIEKLKKLL